MSSSPRCGSSPIAASNGRSTGDERLRPEPGPRGDGVSAALRLSSRIGGVRRMHVDRSVCSRWNVPRNVSGMTLMGAADVAMWLAIMMLRASKSSGLPRTGAAFLKSARNEDMRAAPRLKREASMSAPRSAWRSAARCPPRADLREDRARRNHVAGVARPIRRRSHDQGKLPLPGDPVRAERVEFSDTCHCSMWPQGARAAFATFAGVPAGSSVHEGPHNPR